MAPKIETDMFKFDDIYKKPGSIGDDAIWNLIKRVQRQKKLDERDKSHSKKLNSQPTVFFFYLLYAIA